MLKAHLDITFFCLSIPSSLIEELRDYGFNLKMIKCESDFFDLVDAKSIIVLDGYKFNSDYQQVIKATGAKLVCIDDLHEGKYYADLIINHNPDALPTDYKSQPYTQYALGLDYVLLRPKFLGRVSNNRIIESIETVMICFGGSDIKDLTRSVLKTVTEYKQFRKISIVTGASYNFDKTFFEQVKCDSRFEYKHSISEEEMLYTFLNSDLAIVPASGILFEAISTGCLVISGMYTDNQRFVYESFLKTNLIVDGKDFSSKAIHESIKSVLKHKIKNPCPIDGKSQKRLVYRFYETFSELRKISKNDCKLLFLWANDPAVRINSIRKELISWETHLKWFNEKISSLDSKIFILEFQEMAIGQIRFDRKSYKTWMIDYSIDNNYRGEGFGKLILSKAMVFFQDAIFEAIVNQKNKASVEIFNFFNFTKVRQEIFDSEVFDVLEKRV